MDTLRAIRDGFAYGMWPAHFTADTSADEKATTRIFFLVSCIGLGSWSFVACIAPIDTFRVVGITLAVLFAIPTSRLTWVESVHMWRCITHHYNKEGGG